MRFKDDLKLWLTHIDFAKKNVIKIKVLSNKINFYYVLSLLVR